MKTHDLAAIFSQLSNIFMAAPNIEAEDLSQIISPDKNNKKSLKSTDEVAVNLLTLADLSKVGRQDWLAIIEEYQIPIQIRPRDASSNIIQRLVSYLSRNPDALEKFRTSTKKPTAASPELMKALDFLKGL